jgi:hypothetical protein
MALADKAAFDSLALHVFNVREVGCMDGDVTSYVLSLGHEARSNQKAPAVQRHWKNSGASGPSADRILR